MSVDGGPAVRNYKNICNVHGKQNLQKCVWQVCAGSRSFGLLKNVQLVFFNSTQLELTLFEKTSLHQNSFSKNSFFTGHKFNAKMTSLKYSTEMILNRDVTWCNMCYIYKWYILCEKDVNKGTCETVMSEVLLTKRMIHLIFHLGRSAFAFASALPQNLFFHDACI